ncbi:hypothetical protein T09_2801 [Trichinella sp. T9]|nr:hypothetical protein T09_2801 [Trichinella sp. T9]
MARERIVQMVPYSGISALCLVLFWCCSLRTRIYIFFLTSLRVWRPRLSKVQNSTLPRFMYDEEI